MQGALKRSCQITSANSVSWNESSHKGHGEKPQSPFLSPRRRTRNWCARSPGRLVRRARLDYKGSPDLQRRLARLGCAHQGSSDWRGLNRCAVRVDSVIRRWAHESLVPCTSGSWKGRTYTFRSGPVRLMYKRFRRAKRAHQRCDAGLLAKSFSTSTQPKCRCASFAPTSVSSILPGVSL